MKVALTRLSETFARIREVPVRDCVHFCAYRYGRDEPNPYERYAMALVKGVSLQEIRKEFVHAVSRYRPRNLGQALGTSLSRPYPLWWLPWRKPEQVVRFPGWVRSANDVIDVMTHFSDEGIPRKQLEKEYAWHENAFYSISRQGYQPERHSFITARELRGERSSYLVTDGNHRISMLSALGVRSVTVKLPRGTTVVRADVEEWPLVRAGMMARDDALAVFDAYHLGNRTPVSSIPAVVVG